MNAQHPIHHPRVLLSVSMLLCAALVVGCQDIETPVGPELDTSAVSETAGVTFAGAKPVCDPPTDPPHPSCKPDGGGGGGSAFTVAMTGGLVTTSDQVRDTFKDNKKRIIGEADIVEVKMNLVNTPLSPNDCSFNCDEASLSGNPALNCNIPGPVYNSLAEAFVTSDPMLYPGLSVAFDKDDALAGEPSGQGCLFTGISDLGLGQGGGVVIRNCMVTYEGDPATIDDDTIERTFKVHVHEDNTVSTGRRFDANEDGEVGQTEYRADLVCPLQVEFTVTFAPEQP